MRRLTLSLVTALAMITLGCGGPSVHTFAVGECFDDTPELLAGDGVGDLPILDCDEPHDNEVFFVADFPGAAFDLDAIQQFAVEACLDEFEPFVGEPYATSVLDFGILYPTQDS